MTAALVSSYLRPNVDRNSQFEHKYPSDLAVFPPILILLHVPGYAETIMCFNGSAQSNLSIFIQYWVNVSIAEISLSPSLTFTL